MVLPRPAAALTEACLRRHQRAAPPGADRGAPVVPLMRGIPLAPPTRTRRSEASRETCHCHHRHAHRVHSSPELHRPPPLYPGTRLPAPTMPRVAPCLVPARRCGALEAPPVREPARADPVG